MIDEKIHDTCVSTYSIKDIDSLDTHYKNFKSINKTT